ncbi:MAG: NAD(P)-dependent oxidoreductase [Acetobacter sp.]|nr:NAD(P)-dependent oxidoreductase [Bacteroides sp.]MCM1341933.1 NAD(P)-dependent oxidoreductase [Acetobacter sp.]MCM1434117.1 NAD(P)-dependent oxidoreductase [Clostridiales bacterium]
MNIFMIGGTGLLGCEAAHQLIKMGHKVTSVALPPLPEGAPIPEEMEIIFGDINKRSDDEILELLKGNDVFIFAAGVDERVEFPAPVLDYYKKFNIAPLERMFPLCKKAGIKRAVVLGSYFSYLAKIKPEMQCAQKNKYIKSRLMQEDVCEAAADENFSTCVLELPYIFGTQPGRKPVWTILIEQIAFMDKWPFTMYPKGGTAMLTCRQVGQVIAGAAVKDAKGFEAIPIGMYNMKWDKFLGIVYDARGMSGRKIVGCAPWMMKMGMGKIVKEYAEKGIDSGIDPLHLPYIMDYDLFINSTYAKELGATEDDIEYAIHDSIKVSVAAYNGTAKLLEMKGE